MSLLALTICFAFYQRTAAEPVPQPGSISGTISENEPQGRSLTIQLKSSNGNYTCLNKIPFDLVRKFEFKSVPPGRYHLSVLNTPTKIEFQLGEGENKKFELLVDTVKTASVKINFLRGQKSCSGEQLKVSFYPSPETSTYEPFPLRRQVTTGSLHLLGLNEGIYFLKIYELSNRAALYSLDLAIDKEVNEFNIQLDYDCSFYGTVIDEKNSREDGIFVQAAMIGTAFSEDAPALDAPKLLEFKSLAISDYNGKFLFRGLREGIYSVNIEPSRENPLVIEGFVDQENTYPSNVNFLATQPPKTVNLKKSESPDEIVLEVTRCESTLSGKITHYDGKPAKKATVYARPDRLNRGQNKPLIFKTTANASGKFNFPDLPEDIYRLDADIEGYPPAALYNVRLAGSAQVELKLPQKTDLYNINGAVLPEIPVAVPLKITLLPRTMTGTSNVFNSELQYQSKPNGSFSISNIYPGTYDVLVGNYIVISPGIISLSSPQKNRDVTIKVKKPAEPPQVKVVCRKKIVPCADITAFLAQVSSADVTIFAKDNVNGIVNGAAISPALNDHLIAGLPEGEYNIYMLSTLGNVHTLRQSLPVTSGQTVNLEYDLDK